jgi:hypothetical protein
LMKTKPIGQFMEYWWWKARLELLHNRFMCEG